MAEAATAAAAVPKTVEERIRRGRAQMRKNAARRRLFYKFWRGETYWYVNSRGLLVSQDTISWNAGGRMPPHRIRNSYPFVASIVGAKVSAATQRVPGYEIVPSTTEPQDAQAATLAEKVAFFGYDEWRLRRATTKTVEHALVGGEGFAYPFFDTSIGPFFTDPETGEAVGQGDVRVIVVSANEVYWESGCDFEESRWHVIEQARPTDVVRATPGYLGGELTADALDSDAPTEESRDELVIVREYLERPSAERPQGRRLVIANDRQIMPEESYPCVNGKGEVLDEPVLLRLSYIAETDDRDRGLVELLVDLQRTIQDTWNKILEWKNRALNPQMVAPRGANMARRDDTPGATWLYTPIGGQKPEWETPPPVPRELFTILDKAIEHVRQIAADVDVQAEPDLAARTAQAAIEESRQRWQSFLGDLAEFHSRLMRRCLYLVQRHYTEPRLIKVQGLFGPDLTPGFLGADLLGQADVRVSADSLATRSRKAVLEEVLLFADRGWISPQAAMAAINGGIAERVFQSYVYDYGRANHLIQMIKRGPGELFRSSRPRPGRDGELIVNLDAFDRASVMEQAWRAANGERPLSEREVPGWMPRPFDNVDIHREVFETWMKTAEWDRLPDEAREIATLYHDALVEIAQRQQLEAQAAQQQQARALGEANAAKPQQAAPTPDQRLPALAQ